MTINYKSKKLKINSHLYDLYKLLVGQPVDETFLPYAAKHEGLDCEKATDEELIAAVETVMEKEIEVVTTW